MSRPISSPKTVSISQAIDQDALNKVTAFKKSLGPNDRVLVTRSGNTTTYTQHKESASEKFSRKLGNFEKNVKTAWSHVSDLFTVQNQGNGSEATKNIKNTLSHKSLPPESSSISIKQFNSQIAPITNICIIPVLEDLTSQTRAELKNLGNMLGTINSLDRALDFFSTSPQNLEKIKQEFSAFLKFAESQAQGKSVTHQNRDAIEFANRLVAIPITEHRELMQRFGESFRPIFNAALALATFALTSPSDKS